MKKKRSTATEHTFKIPGMSATDDGAPDGAFILTIEGLEASGKNHLAFQAPGNIACFSVDSGTKREVRRARSEGKSIHLYKAEYEVPTFIPKQDRDYWIPKAKEVREEVLVPYLDAWNAAKDEAEIRAMVQDTGTDFWELHRLAHFGKLQQNPQLAYGPVNKEFMGTITGAKNAGKLVILLHQLADEYKDVMDPRTQQMKSERTGRLKRVGHNKIGFLSDAIVRTRRDEKKQEWLVDIVLCKADRSMDGTTLEDPSFADLMAILDPHTDPSFWEE